MQNPVKSNCFKGLYYLLNPLNLNMIRMHVLLTLLLRFLKLLTRRIFFKKSSASFIGDHFLYSCTLICDSGVIF